MKVQSIVEVLEKNATEAASREACTFLEDGDSSTITWDYGTLWTKARAIASVLQSSSAPRARALLLYPPGLEFMAAFLGCLAAKAIPVPLFPPQPRELASGEARLARIIENSGAEVLLCTGPVAEIIESMFSHDSPIGRLRRVKTDEIADEGAAAWKPTYPTPEDVAFVQYTSGSTSHPKGVAVTHGNLTTNCLTVTRLAEMGPSARMVVWVPVYHDMGLVGGTLTPIFSGCPITMLSPVDFIQKPRRWLDAITRFRGTVTASPSFALDYCVRKIPPDAREGLELSSLKIAFVGAERTHAKTIERFADAFGPCGLRRGALYPGYGLAESTLFVTGGELLSGPKMRTFDVAKLEQGRAVSAEPGAEPVRTLVACGQPQGGLEVLIVDPESFHPLEDGREGEIWLRGPSVAAGYWNNPEKTEEVFAATAVGRSGRWLRTGDRGFLFDGELFVTGRYRDLIIIRGRNILPPDLEHTVEGIDPAIRPGCAAAFAVDDEASERIVVFAEVSRRDSSGDGEVARLAGLVEKVKMQLFRDHRVNADVFLVAPGTIPKTTSGKIQRWKCRELYVQGNFERVV